MNRYKVFVLTLILVCLGMSTSVHAQELDQFRGLYEEYKGSVFKISTRYSEGTGFLINRNGLVLTNAHVVSGTQGVQVQLNDSLKYEGVVIASDPSRDLAVVALDHNVVSGLPPFTLAPTGVTSGHIGRMVGTMGYPLIRGPVLTTGIISFATGDVAVSDINLNPGNSGGPVFDSQGYVVGVSTFRLTPNAGQGLSGIVSVAAAESILQLAESRLPTVSVPTGVALPVLPLTPYPWEALQAAALADRWPDRVYDITNHTVRPEFRVQLFTPPFIYRQLVRGGEGDGEVRDLRRWELELNRYPSVVILRVTPMIRQSIAAFWMNLILGGASAATNSVYTPIYVPEWSGDVEDVRLSMATGDPTVSQIMQPAEVIQERYARIHFEGRVAEAVYLTLDPQIFAPEGDHLPQIFIEVINRRRGGEVARWRVPDETVRQVWSDFAAARTASEARP